MPEMLRLESRLRSDPWPEAHTLREANDTAASSQLNTITEPVRRDLMRLWLHGESFAILGNTPTTRSRKPRPLWPPPVATGSSGINPAPLDASSTAPFSKTGHFFAYSEIMKNSPEFEYSLLKEAHRKLSLNDRIVFLKEHQPYP
jgi:hypothetical protein